MKRFSLVCSMLVCAGAAGWSDPAPAGPTEMKDPRTILVPVILYHHQQEHFDGLTGPFLIYARWDRKPPNQILGVEGSFTDEQIVAGLRKFYLEWRPPAQHPTQPPPQLILAQQNWGCGGTLYAPLQTLSEEYKIDVYTLYPVITNFASDPT